MTEARMLLHRCRKAGIILTADGDGILYDAPADVIVPVDELRRHKAQLLVLLRQRPADTPPGVPSLRQACLQAAEAAGWPAVPIRPGERVACGETAWRRFTENAATADVQIAFDNLPVSMTGPAEKTTNAAHHVNCSHHSDRQIHNTLSIIGL